MSRERVMIFDTTLRDGEQSPGCSMAQPEKLRVARALADLGVDVIEAGFPAASRGDWEASTPWRARCRDRSSAASRVAIATTSSSWPRRSQPAREPAHPRVPRHQRHPSRSSSSTWRRRRSSSMAVEGVKFARELCEDVEFSPEDASRTELDFLTQVVEAVIEAGATTVNIPDTVGYTVPDEFAELFRYLRKNVRGIDKIRLSVHCHDDLGMAVANSLTAVVAGARQIECTINGIGERAGNCSLEEVVMALKTRDAFFNLDTKHRHHPPLSHVAHAGEHRRHADPAQQGDRRRERVRARVGHPSARHAQASLAPTRSCGRRTSACRARRWCWASTAAATRCASASRSWASSSTTSSSRACSRNSRRSRTRRRSSTTATSRRWCCRPSTARRAPGRC